MYKLESERDDKMATNQHQTECLEWGCVCVCVCKNERRNKKEKQRGFTGIIIN